ncbi:MAG: DNA polymerase Y family protein, partial [Pseudomonadota bacterium]
MADTRAENRICAVHFPTFPTDRLQRLHGLSGHAVATVEKAKGASVIASANPNCERIGIAAGQTLAEARALYPDLVALPAEPEADMAALTLIARAADRFTPLV